MSKEFVFGARSRRCLYGTETNPGVKKITVDLCIRALGFSTVDFGITDGFRTLDAQNALYKEGSTTLDGITKLSDHQSGFAIDVVPVVYGSNGAKLSPWDVHLPEVAKAWMEVYRAFMRASLKLKLHLEFGLGYNISGGRDYPHISIKAKHGKRLK